MTINELKQSAPIPDPSSKIQSFQVTFILRGCNTQGEWRTREKKGLPWSFEKFPDRRTENFQKIFLELALEFVFECGSAKKKTQGSAASPAVIPLCIKSAKTVVISTVFALFNSFTEVNYITCYKNQGF